MTSTAEVDFAELTNLASRLDASAVTVGSVAAPGAIAAGAGAASTARILRHLAVNAANVCDALEVSAAGVRDSRDHYSEVDERSSAALRSLGTNW